MTWEYFCLADTWGFMC